MRLVVFNFQFGAMRFFIHTPGSMPFGSVLRNFLVGSVLCNSSSSSCLPRWARKGEKALFFGERASAHFTLNRGHVFLKRRTLKPPPKSETTLFFDALKDLWGSPRATSRGQTNDFERLFRRLEAPSQNSSPGIGKYFWMIVI